MIKSTICEEDDRMVMYFEGWLDTSEVKKAKKEMGPLLSVVIVKSFSTSVVSNIYAAVASDCLSSC